MRRPAADVLLRFGREGSRCRLSNPLVEYERAEISNHRDHP
jgi:hypothetical protein